LLLLLPQVPGKALSSLGASSFQQLPAQLVQLAKAFQACTDRARPFPDKLPLSSTLCMLWKRMQPPSSIR
jgi:hypothetical protein